jgi:hypothetical protein
MLAECCSCCRSGELPSGHVIGFSKGHRLNHWKGGSGKKGRLSHTICRWKTVTCHSPELENSTVTLNSSERKHKAQILSVA